MQQSIPRSTLLSEAISGLEEAPAVALLGARQVGKTTLARQLAAAWPGRSTAFDLEYPLAQDITALPLKKVGDLALQTPRS